MKQCFYPHLLYGLDRLSLLSTLSLVSCARNDDAYLVISKLDKEW